MTDTKKPGKQSSTWAGVGDSAEGIRHLRPDALRQVREQIKSIDTQIRQNGLPSTKTTPVASSTGKPPKGK